ncbi:MAG: MATE family efflux transporter [Clostridiales bacterium]|nr:MATE family efflux transporter [Clostridiales bacterium]
MKGDFTQGKMWRNILAQAVPLTVAQLVQVLYNIVDRIYIGHLPGEGELALTGIGISAPIVTLISAFTLLFGQGGAPLCAIAEGAGNQDRAQRIFGNTLSLLLGTSAVVLAVCLIFERRILFLFGASEETYAYAHQYFSVYILGTVCVMFSTGMNGFINLQGYPRIGMLTTVLGAVINLVLDPIFIFGLNLGITGAATATVLAQTVSALWVLQFFLSKKSRLRVRRADLAVQPKLAREITTLGLTGFMMSATNSLVQIVCNQMLGAYGGDLYISVMTVLNSVRELFTLPVQGLTSGAQPVLGYNYGAKDHGRVRQGIAFMTALGFAYTLVAWLAILLLPRTFVGLFTTDSALLDSGAEAIRIYFFAFVFMSLQFSAQSTFVSLGRAKSAVFFSIFRKVILVVPLTLLLPRWMGVYGVFVAEPISNVIGGLASFTTMLVTVWRPLGREAGPTAPSLAENQKSPFENRS